MNSKGRVYSLIPSKEDSVREEQLYVFSDFLCWKLWAVDRDTVMLHPCCLFLCFVMTVVEITLVECINGTKIYRILYIYTDILRHVLVKFSAHTVSRVWYTVLLWSCTTNLKNNLIWFRAISYVVPVLIMWNSLTISQLGCEMWCEGDGMMIDGRMDWWMMDYFMVFIYSLHRNWLHQVNQLILQRW